MTKNWRICFFFVLLCIVYERLGLRAFVNGIAGFTADCTIIAIHRTDMATVYMIIAIHHMDMAIQDFVIAIHTKRYCYTSHRYGYGLHDCCYTSHGYCYGLCES